MFGIVPNSAELCDWSGGRDSNPRQPAWEAGTLPTELPPRRSFEYTSRRIRSLALKSHAALTGGVRVPILVWSMRGGVAQLGERYNRTVEVGGSSPPASTRAKDQNDPADCAGSFSFLASFLATPVRSDQSAGCGR